MCVVLNIETVEVLFHQECVNYRESPIPALMSLLLELLGSRSEKLLQSVPPEVFIRQLVSLCALSN